MCLRLDATVNDSSLGRLVNDEHRLSKINSKMKIVIDAEEQPHLCLFATRKIIISEEIRYSYGTEDLSFPWRVSFS